MHQIDKLKNFLAKSIDTIQDKKFLDTLNVSEVAILKIREFRSYVKHNFSSYTANQTLHNLLENTLMFSDELFNKIFSDLKSSSAQNISLKGYENMRKFIYKV